MSGPEALKMPPPDHGNRNDRRGPEEAHHSLDPSQHERSSFSAPILAAGFILAFFSALALIFTGGIVARQLTGRPSSLPERVDPFPDSFPIFSPNLALHVPDAAGLDPVDGTDFLFFSWFRLRKTVAVNERVMFIAKYDPNSKIRPGYSFGLKGASDGTRPIVYWQNEREEGKWFTFTGASVRAREWYLMVISFRKGRFLGVHLVPHTSPKSVEVLGGYDVGESVSPCNAADLVVGSFSDGSFRGRLGPFGVISRENLSDDLSKLIKEMAKTPLVVPSWLPPENVFLWSYNRKDMGIKKLAVTVEGLSPERSTSAE